MAISASDKHESAGGEPNGKSRNGGLSPPENAHTDLGSLDSLESIGNYIPTPPDGGWGWVVVFGM